MIGNPLVQRWLVVGIILLFLAAGVTPSTAQQKETPSLPLLKGTWLYVGGSGPHNYTKIQDAIDNASDGDTVFVYRGTYIGFIVANKAIHLIGEDKNTTCIIGYFAYTITLNADGVTVSGFTIHNNASRGEGVRIDSSYNTIINNIIDIPRDRIRLFGNHNAFCDNVINNTYLYLCGDSNTISENIFNNSYYGMYLIHCRSNIISHNSFIGSGLFISDGSVGENIVTNNLVNGKPLVYLSNESDVMLDGGAGQIILFNCSYITVQNQELCNTTVGIQLWDSSSCNISGNILARDRYGMYLRGRNNTIGCNTLAANFYGVFFCGDDNTVSGNNITHSQGNGLYMLNSDNNTILKNTFALNNYSVILDYGCDFNSVTMNIFRNNNQEALGLFGCSSACIIGNIIENNDGDGVYLSQSDDNKILYNTLRNNNGCGISIFTGQRNTILHNNVTQNDGEGLHLAGDHTEILSNTFEGNSNGISITGHKFNAITNNTITMNTLTGIFLNCSTINTILGNAISKNTQGVYLVSSTNNTLRSNIFQRNKRNALFENCTNIWDQNYWSRPRILPKIIVGIRKAQHTWSLPLIDIDWHPARGPYGSL